MKLSIESEIWTAKSSGSCVTECGLVRIRRVRLVEKREVDVSDALAQDVHEEHSEEDEADRHGDEEQHVERCPADPVALRATSESFGRDAHS